MKKTTLLLSLIIFGLASESILAQYGEPEIQSVESPKNLFNEGYKKGFGFSFNLNDFGFAAGTQFRLGLAPYTEGLLSFKIAGLRDPSEQVYIDQFFGGRVVPSKYQRVITFPLTIGLKRRIFARQITDNFRVHTAMSFGPTLALVTPYFQDFNENGYREANSRDFGGYFEPVIDVFAGLKDTKTEWGWTGDLALGIDFGENFARLQTFQFGYSFFYFKNGLQILEPFQPQRNPDGTPIFMQNGSGDPVLQLEPYNKTANFLGSAQITFIFGWMW